MSLAERFAHADRSTHAGVADAAHTIDNILRLALNSGRPRTAESPPPRPTIPDFQSAVAILDRASEAMANLRAKCAQLEQQIAAERENFKAELKAAVDQTREWERRAVSVKAQLEDADSQLSDAQVRADAAGRRADAADARVQLAEQRAEAAAEQARLYHGKIVEIFGPQD